MGWYYIRPGIISDETHGPLEHDAIRQLAFDGKLKPDTRVIHAEQTGNQWATVANVPWLITARIEGISLRELESDQAKEDMRKLKAQKKTLIESVSMLTP